MEICMPTGRLFSKPRLARTRLPRYTGAMERKPCSSRFVRSLALTPVLAGQSKGKVSLGLRWGQNIIIHDKTSNI